MNPTDFIRHRVASMLLGILLPAAPGALAAAPSDSAPNSRSVHRNQTPIVRIGPLEFHGRNHGERVAIGRDVVLASGACRLRVASVSAIGGERSSLSAPSFSSSLSLAECRRSQHVSYTRVAHVLWAVRCSDVCFCVRE
jgi:hypothetical protein